MTVPPATAPRIEVHESADALATAVAGELLGPARRTPRPAAHEPQIALTGGTIADAVHRELARLSAGLRGRLVAGRRLVGRRAVRRRPTPPTATPRQARDGLPRPGRRRPGQGARDAVDRRRGLDVDDGARRRTPTTLRDARRRRVRRADARRRARTATSPRCSPASRSSTSTTGSPSPSPARPSRRRSGSRLTFGALNRAEAVWFLVSGEEKAAAVARALADGTDLHDIPAAGVTGARRPSGSSTAPPPPASDAGRWLASRR